MPRKNQKRKNANSQSGRRKAKPIKFNPSDIENEQSKLCASIEEDDAVDDEQEQEQQQHQDHDSMMESIVGSVRIQEDNVDVGSDNNQIISNSTLNGNEIDHTNQTDKTDDVQNGAGITIPVAYNDSIANSTLNCNFKCRNYFFLFSIELISPFFLKKRREKKTY